MKVYAILVKNFGDCPSSIVDKVYVHKENAKKRVDELNIQYAEEENTEAFIESYYIEDVDD